MYFIKSSFSLLFRPCHDSLLPQLMLLLLASFITCQQFADEPRQSSTTEESNSRNNLLYQPRLPLKSSDASDDSSDDLASPASNNPALQDHSSRVYPWNREEYPNPLLQPVFCRNQYPTHICDPNDILNSRHKSQLTKIIRRLADLKCYCNECNADTHGIAVGIAMMEAIYRQYMVHPSNNTQNFTEYLRQKWKLGLCDNDIIILVAVHDRQWYPALGSTVEKLIPKETLKSLKEQTKKAFSRGEYYRGLELFLQGIENSTLKDTSEKALYNQDFLTKLASDQDSDVGYFLGISFLAFLVLVVSCLALYMLLSWQRRRDQQSKTVGDIEKKHPVHTAATDDEDDDDEDVVVYDRQSSNGEDEKKPSLTWSGIRNKLSSHRTAPATEAEKAVLNQEQHSPSAKIQQDPLVKSTGEPGHARLATDDEIEPIDIETINTNDQVNSNDQVYKETTIGINK